ncbi:MAG TPA: hypothetical protein VHE78_18575, partial [Gemmatimonadaceae bacterium]|nr:hypothetical protein [Gemmatimonadaceae bacterium]
MTPLQLVTVCAVLSSSLCKPIGAQAAQPPSVADWGHDVDAIVRDIRTTHPDPFTITGRVTFLRAAQALRQALPSLSEEQRVAAAMRLVASIGDGHTQLEPNGNARFSDWYPIRLYEFTDGFFVTTAHRSVGELAGAEVLNIAGHPAAEVVAAARTLMGADNAFGRLENLYAVHSASLMKGLGYAAADGSLRVTCKLRDGTVVERTLVPRKTNSPGVSPDDANFGTWSSRREMFGPPIDSAAEWVAAFRQLPATAFRVADTTRPPHLMNPRLQMTYALPAWKAYYIQLNFINNTSTETFPGLIQRALREVDELKPRRLIVDLRYNYGGDGSAVRAMIQEFIARQNHQPWNELYVLVGRRTFSAAILALGEFLDYTQVTLVGEPPGAARNAFGDAMTFEYPRTGLHLRVSTVRHQGLASTDLSEIIPVDVPARFSFADYAAGRDPAVDPILRGDEMRS